MDNKNEPAFPTNHATDIPENGLTKREYFAGLAMQGMCANQEYSGKHSNSANQIAHKAIELADALLNELSK